MWKLKVLATAGALPTSTAHLTIDPSTDGNITLRPNGTGTLVVESLGLGPVLASASGALSSAGAGVAGQVLKSNGPGVAPTWQNDINYTYQEVTGTTVNLVANNGYVLNNVNLVTATLPATAAFGTTIIIIGKGVGGWKVEQQAGQTIHFEGTDTTPGITGSVASTNRYDCIELVCITADTDWVIRNSATNLTMV